MTDLLYSFDTSSLLNGRRDLLPPEIGLARARGCAVVTEETPSGRLDRPRIPDVCGALGVRCLNLVGFIKDQGWTF